jgi:hypothetical protein
MLTSRNRLVAGALLVLASTLIVRAQNNTANDKPSPSSTPLDFDQIPWGIGSSASSTRTYAEWFPKLADAGVHWTRMFPEWNGIEKTKGNFDFASTDAMLDSAKANNMEVSGLVFGKCPWGPGGLHSFPMQNLDDWTDYAAAISDHFKGRIHYWEVWNEGNAGFNDGHNNTADYANLVAAAYAGVKKSDSTAQVGMSVASFDPAYLDQAIIDQGQSGKTGSFDYLCIHPYETFGLIGDVDGEVPYLWMTRMLRDELKADAPPDKANAPIWITEVGRPIDRSTNESGIALGQDVHEIDAAKAMVKAYVMAVAQGIARICWFEAQDPHGEPGGYGLLNIDGKPRVSYVAMKAMTSALGETPKYQGWLALGPDKRSYGFVFQNGASSAMAIWMPAGMSGNITFTADVKTVDPMTDSTVNLKASQPLALTDSPLFVTNLPADLIAQAKANADKNFPWGGDYSGTDTVTLEPGPKPVSNGVILQGKKNPYVFDDGSTGIEVEGKIGSGANFYTHPSFAGIKNKEYYIRISFRRIGPGNVGMNFSCEVADSQGQGPLRHNGGWYSVGADMGWQTHTWHVTDACFAKMWGFDFCLQPEQSVPFVVGKVEVSTKPFAN